MAAGDMPRRLDDVVAVYGEAMGYRPSCCRPGRGYIGAARPPAGFRAVAALDDAAGSARLRLRLRPGPGQWWHDQVRAALRRPARRRGSATLRGGRAARAARPPRATASARGSCARCSAMADGRPCCCPPRRPTRRRAGLAALPPVRLRGRAAALHLPRRRAAVRDARPGAAAGSRPRTRRASSASDGAGSVGAAAVLVLTQIAYPLTGGGPGGADRRDRRARLLLSVGARAAHPRAAGGRCAGRDGDAAAACGRGGRGGDRLPVRHLRLRRDARAEAARRAAGHPAGLDLDGLAGLAGRGAADPRPRPPGSRWRRPGWPPGTCSSTRRWSPRALALALARRPRCPACPACRSATTWAGSVSRCCSWPCCRRPRPTRRPGGRRRCSRSASGRTSPRCWPTRCSSGCRRRRAWGGSAMGAVALPLAGRSRLRWRRAVMLAWRCCRWLALTVPPAVNAAPAAPPGRRRPTARRVAVLLPVRDEAARVAPAWRRCSAQRGVPDW